MAKYPIGIQTFEKLRKDDYTYVDKTDLIYQLAHNGSFYFLSRPRRFGKSLLISTLDAYFSGKKELFKGLAIEKLEKEWTPCPVFHVDFNGGKFTSVENLKNLLSLHLNQWEEVYGTGKDEREPEERFRGLIERACKQTGQKVAILVDEYDKPLLHNIGNEQMQDAMRTELKAFFSQIKNQDQYIRFGFFTGVTNFISSFINLINISFDKRYERICGISKQELVDVFKHSIAEMAKPYNLDYKTMLAHLQAKYGGYHFSKGMTDILNPYSILHALSNNKLDNYWFSAPPSFLVELIKEKGQSALDILNNFVISEILFEFVGLINNQDVALMYLNGILTIRDYDKEEDLYRLKIPNEEVLDIFKKTYY